MAESPTNGINRLSHILNHTPKPLAKDFRNVLLAGLGTRDAGKITGMNGAEFALTVWVLGLWLVRPSSLSLFPSREGEGEDEKRLFEARITRWIAFLAQVHDADKPSIKHGSLSEDAHERLPTTLDGSLPTDDPPVLISSSYLAAIHASVAKHPRSIYNNSAEVTVERLMWCLRIVREEGVRCPILKGGGEEGEEGSGDELVLFMDMGED